MAWASGGIDTAVTLTEDNSLGKLYGRHLIVRFSRFGDQKDLSVCRLSQSHHE